MFVLRGIWRALNFLRAMVLNLLLIVLVGGLLVFAFTSQDEPEMPDEAILVLKPGVVIVEQRRLGDPFDTFLYDEREYEEQTLLSDLLKVLAHARDDERVRLLVLNLEYLYSASPASLTALGRALADFKSSGKPVYAFAHIYNEPRYYLASHADRVLVEDSGGTGLGGVFMNGFGSYPLYMKDALDSLKVEVQVFQAGEYKSAAEPLTRNNMSEKARENTRYWLNGLWDQYQASVMQRRQLAGPDLSHYVNNYDQLLADAENHGGKLAVSYGLADDLITRHEWKELLDKETDSAERIEHRSYLESVEDEFAEEDADNRIGLIVASGTIQNGKQPDGAIGGKTLSGLIRKARRDDDVKALVLRINTGGGSAYASEMIRREIALTREAGKPVVVSMGGVAASGGYWVASGADRILAEPTTVTGSIGVFAVLSSLHSSFAAIGLHSDGVGTTKMSDINSGLAPLNPILSRSVQQSVNQTYAHFIGLVAEGRSMQPEAVRKLAEGRVYTGSQAKDLGLVDELGGSARAVALAAELAELEDYALKDIAREPSFRERLVQEIMEIRRPSGFLAQLLPLGSLVPLQERSETVFQQLADQLASLARLDDPNGVYLLCFSCEVH